MFHINPAISVTFPLPLAPVSHSTAQALAGTKQFILFCYNQMANEMIKNTLVKENVWKLLFLTMGSLKSLSGYLINCFLLVWAFVFVFVFV